MLRARSEYLLAFELVAALGLDGAGLELRRVGAGRGLGHAEGLQPQLAGRDLRQVFPLLRFAPVPEHRAHRVHLRVARGGVASGGAHFFQDHGGGAQRQTGAAVFLGYQRREKAGFRSAHR